MNPDPTPGDDYYAADAQVLGRLEATLIGRIQELARLVDISPGLNYAQHEERIAQRARLQANRAVLADITRFRNLERLKAQDEAALTESARIRQVGRP